MGLRYRFSGFLGWGVGGFFIRLLANFRGLPYIPIHKQHRGSFGASSLSHMILFSTKSKPPKS